MPRIVIYGPYPTATAAVTAVLGTLALLHLQGRERSPALAFFALEGLVFLTLAITLTRSIVAGWLLGAIAAALLFGTAWRRVLAIGALVVRSEEHTSELQSLMRISYAVFCLKKKNKIERDIHHMITSVTVSTK